MRYHYEKPEHFHSMYGKLYSCNHAVYSRCTLFMIKDKGLSVIQQRYNSKNKTTWWTEIDPWINDDLYLNEGFERYFNQRAKEVSNGLYPTVTVRQIMWALKMKPLPKESWETVFDRAEI